MPDRKAIDRGFAFENRVARELGGRVQPGSGNKFYAKNDIIANGLSISCKSQAKFTWAEIKRYLDQSIDDSYGMGNIPALALDENNDSYIVMRLSDLAKAFQEEISIPKNYTSKGQEKRAIAEVPIMLR